MYSRVREVDGGVKASSRTEDGAGFSRRRLLASAAVIVLGVVLGSVGHTADEVLAKPAKVKVRVYDGAGRKLSGAVVHIYEGTVPPPHQVDKWCACKGEKCEVKPAQSATTGKSGQVQFGDLNPNTTYTVAVDDSCRPKVGDWCELPTDCEYKASSSGGYSKELTTNSKGGSSTTVELNP